MEQWELMRKANQDIRAAEVTPDGREHQMALLRDFMDDIEEAQERCEEINLGQQQDSQGRVIGAPAMLTPFVRGIVEDTFETARQLLAGSPWTAADEYAGSVQVRLLLGRPACRVRAVLRHLDAVQEAVTEARAELLLADTRPADVVGAAETSLLQLAQVG